MVRKHGTITSDDFLNLEILKNHEFDDVPTQFPIPKDTSTAPTLSGLNLMRSDRRISDKDRRTLFLGKC
jgi:hypothetical protein